MNAAALRAVVGSLALGCQGQAEPTPEVPALLLSLGAGRTQMALRLRPC